MGYVGRGLNQDGGQYRKLDSIASSFDGSEVNFNLTIDGLEVTPTAQNLMISLGGVIQEPGSAFSVSGGTITFASAPEENTTFFGVLMGEATFIARGTVGAAEMGTTAGEVTGSKGLVVDSSKNIQGFNEVSATKFDGIFNGALSSSAQIADNISGSIAEPSGNVSGSSASTGSFGKVEVGGGKITTAGNIVLDADGAQIRLEDGGTEFGRISRVSSDLVIKSISNNNDILFKGVDGSATITALTLDMSEAGSATFNSGINATTGTITGDFTVGGTLTAQEVHTEFESASIIFTSGSTIFGNSTDDTHLFSGSVSIHNGEVGVAAGGSADELVIKNNGDAGISVLSPDGNSSRIQFGSPSDNDIGHIGGYYNSGNEYLFFSVDGSTRMVIGGATDAGNVGIGTDNPQTGRLHIHNGSSGATSYAQFTQDGTGAGSGDGLLVGVNAAEASIIYNAENTPLIFYTNTSERARISAAGNVLIGTTDDDARLMVKKIDGTSYGQFVTIEGDTTDNNNYPGISFKGGTLANAYPEIGASNGGLMFQLSGGYHSSNYNHRTKIQLNGSDGHILFMTGGDPAVERAKLDANGLFKINQNNQGSAGTSNKFLSVGGELSTQFDETDVGTMSGMIVSNEYTNASNQSGTACGIVFTHHSASSGISYIASKAGANSGDRSSLFFGTRGSGGVEERLRLEDNGEIFLGKGGDGYVRHYEIDASDYWYLYAANDGKYHLNFNASGTAEFSLSNSGNLTILGSLTESSDVRLKENIETIPDALSKVNQMRGVSYNKIGEEKVRIGMVADEVEKIIPELVSIGGERGKFDEDGFDNVKSLKYTNMVGVLVEAVKELSEKNDALEKRMEELEK